MWWDSLAPWMGVSMSRLAEILFLAPVAVGMGYAWWLIYTAERDWNGVFRFVETGPAEAPADGRVHGGSSGGEAINRSLTSNGPVGGRVGGAR